uniref:BHLH domain-containing protein n=1 Tax=Anopheles dirus TaxID=7168 RepID=A0A182N6I8_9DIPT
MSSPLVFDANKSTKGASKLRRDLINSEIANLRDLLPLPQSTRQRLSQLQLMALVCVYVRKANYFQQVSDSGFREDGCPTGSCRFGALLHAGGQCRQHDGPRLDEG